MKLGLRSVVAALVTLLSTSMVLAEISAKTGKYLSILVKRPSSDYLFDRFYNSWLEEATSDDLEKYLDQKYEETKSDVYLQLKAYYHEAEGNDDKALDIYNTVLAESSSPSLLFRRGTLELQGLEFERAIADLQKALEQKPKEKLAVEINKLLGKIYIRDEQKAKGLAVWKAMATVSDDEDLAEEIVELMLEEGLFAEALTQIKTLIEKTSSKHKQVTLTLRLGDIYRMQGSKDDALKEYTQTLDLVGVGSWLEKEVLSQIEQVFRADDNLSGLESYLETISKDRKNNIELLRRRAELLQELGESDKAEATYLEIVKLTPMDKENKEAYAELLEKNEKYKESLEVVTSLVKQYSNDQELYVLSSKLHHKLDDTDACLTALKTYIDKDKQSEYSYMRAANMLRNFGDQETAAGIYDQLVAKYPESREGKMQQALNLYQMKKKDEALKLYQALGVTTQIDEMMRLVMTLNTLKEHKTSFEILTQNEMNFQTEYKFFELLYGAANQVVKTDKAYDAALKMVACAVTRTELSKACSSVIYTAKRIDKSEQLLDSVTGKSNKSLNDMILISEIEFVLGEIDRSIAGLDDALKQHKDSPVVLEQKLSIYKRQRDWDSAIATLISLSRIDVKQKTKTMKELVDLCLRADKTEDALKWVAEWKKSSPTATTPYIQEASIYRDRGDLETTISLLKKAMFKFADNENIPRVLAQDLVNSGDITGAESVYWRLIGKSEDLSVKLGLVRSLIQLAQRNDSLDDLKKKLISRHENNPKSIFPPIALAEVNRYNGSYDERRKYLLIATEINTKDISLLREIARIEEDEGQYDRVIESLKKIEKLDVKNKYPNLLAQFYMRSGEEDLAFELLVEDGGGINMPADNVVDTAHSLINSNSDKAASFLKPHVLKSIDDYRIRFLYGIALEEIVEDEQAIDAFISVLNSQKEVTKKKPIANVQNVHFRSYSNYLSKILSPEALELNKIGTRMHQVYSYRNNRNSYRHYGNAQQAFPQPQKLDEIESYVMCHLSAISSRLDEAGKKELEDKLAQNGVRYPDVKLLLCSLNQQNVDYIAAWTKFKERYKGDKVIEQLYAMNLAHRCTDLDQLEAGFETVKALSPQLAVSMVSSGLRRKFDIKPEYYDYCAEVVESAKTSEDMRPELLSGFIMSDADKFPEKYRDLFARKMMELYYTQDFAKLNYWSSHGIWQALIQIEDYKGIIDLINNEVKVMALHPGMNNRYGYGGHYNRNNKLIVALQFPGQANVIPGSVTQIFNKRNRNYYGNHNKPIDKEKASALLDGIKDPVVRLFIADFCKNMTVAEGAVKEILAAKVKSFENALIVASWYGLNERADDAVKTLNNARKWCSKKSEVKKLNAAIIAYAELDGDAESKELAKKSADKLLGLRLSIKEKGELAASLEALDFKELAAKVDAQIDKAVNRTASSTVRTGSGTSRRTRPKNVYQKLQELFSQGKVDDAMALAVREFRKKVRNELTTAQSRSNNSWELRNILNSVKSRNKIKEFIAMIAPETEKVITRKILERAVAHELLKDADNAIKDYKTALEHNESNKAALLRLAFLLSGKGETEEAAKYMKKAAGANVNALGPLVERTMNSNNSGVEYFKVYPLIIEIVKGIKPQMGQQYHWINNLFRRLENEVHSGDVKLPNIFNRNQSVAGSKDVIKAQELLLKRKELYVDLCKAALHIPGCSNMSFGRLEALMTIDKMPPIGKYELAKEALEGSLKSGRYYYGGHNSIHMNGVNMTIKSPERTAVSYALANGKETEVREFLKEFKDRANHITDMIDKLKPLYEGTEDTFLTRAKEFAKEHGQFGPGNKSSLDYIIEARGAKLYKTSLSDLVIERMIKDTEDLAMHFDSTYLSVWIDTICRERNISELRNVSDAVCKRVKEKIVAFSEKHKNGTIFESQNGYMLSQVLQNLAGATGQYELKYLSVIMASLSSQGLISEEGVFRHSNLAWTIERKFRGVSQDFEELRRTALFEELEHFDVLQIPSRGQGGNSLLKVFAANTCNNSTNSKNYLAILEEIKEPTFGARFIITLLKEKQCQGIYNFLDHHLEEFKKLSEEQQKSFAEGLKQLKTVYPFRNTASMVKGAFHDYIEANMNGTATERYEAFVDKKVPQDYYSYMQGAQSLILDLIQSDTKKAKDLFELSVKKLRRYQLRNPNNFGGNNWSMSEQMFNNIRHQGSRDLKKFAFLQEIVPLVKFTQSNRFSFQNEIANIFSSSLYETIRGYSRDEKTKKEARYLAFKQVLENNFETLNEKKYPTIVMFKRALSEAQGTEFDKMIELLKTSKLDAAVKTELTMLITYYKARRKDRKCKVAPELISLYSKQLSDESVSKEKRLMSLNGLSDLFYSSETPELNELIFIGVALLEGEAGIPSDQNVLYNLMDRLFCMKKRDGDWRTAAESVVKVTERVYNKWPQNFNCSERSYNQRAFQFLDLICGTGNTALMKRIVDNNTHRLQQRIETYIILLKHGKVEYAANKFGRYFRTLDDPNRTWSTMRTEEQKNIQEFKAALNDSNACYVFDLYLAFVKNSSDEIKSLAQSFAKDVPDDKQIRKKAIKALSSHHYGKKYMTVFANELFDGIDPSDAIYGRDSNVRNTYAAYLLRNLSTCTQEELDKSMAKIVVAIGDNQNRYNAVSVIRAISQEMRNFVQDSNVKPEYVQENLEKLQYLGVTLTKYADHYSNVSDMFLMTVLMFEYKKDQDGMTNWIGLLDDKKFTQLQANYLVYSMKIFDKLYVDEKGKPDNTTIITEKLKAFDSTALKLVFGNQNSNLENAKKNLFREVTRNVKTLKDLATLKENCSLETLMSSGEINFMRNCLYKTYDGYYRKNKKNRVKAFISMLDDAIAILPQNINTIGCYNFAYVASRLAKDDFQKVLKHMELIENKGDWLNEIHYAVIYQKGVADKVAAPDKAYIQFYVDFFRNEAIPLDKRLNSFYQCRSFFNDAGRRTISRNIIDLLPQAKISQNYINYIYISLINDLNDVAVSEVTRPIMEKLLNQLDAFKKEYQHHNHERNILELNMRLKLGHNDNVKAILENANSDFWKYGDVYMVLINNKKFELLTEQIGKHYAELDVNRNCSYIHRRSKERDEAFKEFSYQSNTDIEYLCKAYYYTRWLTDSYAFGEPNYRSGTSRSKDAAVKLAKELENVTFTDQKIEKAAMSILARHSEVAKVLGSKCKLILGEMKLEEMLKENKSYIINAYSMKLIELFETKQYSELKAEALALIEAKKNSRYKNSVGNIGNIAQGAMCGKLQKQNISEMTDADFDLMLDCMTSLIKSSYRVNNAYRLIPTVTIMTVLKKSPDSALEWLKRFDKKDLQMNPFEMRNVIKLAGKWGIDVKGMSDNDLNKMILDSEPIKYLYSSREKDLVRVRAQMVKKETVKTDNGADELTPLPDSPTKKGLTTGRKGKAKARRLKRLKKSRKSPESVEVSSKYLSRSTA